MVRFHEVSLDLRVSFTGAMAIAKRPAIRSKSKCQGQSGGSI